MIDLSKYRIKEFTAANLSHSEINEELLGECAYYPLPASFSSKPTKCLNCSMSKPNLKCSHSHLLVLTEPNLPPLERKKRKILAKFLKELNLEDQSALREFIERRRNERTNNEG